METKSLVEEYAKIENQIKEFESRKKEIKNTLQEEMTNLGADQIKSDLGMFYFRTSKKWSYPTSVIELENKVKKEVKPLQEEIKNKEGLIKEAKKQSEESGEAIAEETKSLVFKAK